MSEAEAFLGLRPNPAPAKPGEVSLRRKITLVIFAWIAGLWIACPDPRGIGMFLFFPIGLWGFICAALDLHARGETVVLTFGWIFYLALSITTLLMDRKKWFYACWITLAIVLLLNGVGCHAMLKSLGNIH